MDIVGPIAHLTTVLARGIDMRDHQQIVFTIVLDDTTTLQQTPFVLLALEDMHIGTLDHVGEVGLQFHQFACTIDDIHTTIVIEEQ